MGPKINIKFKHVFALVFLIAFTLIIFRPYSDPGFPAGFDVLPHMSRVDQIKQIMDQSGTYIDWSDDWYGGHNLLHFYPPLSYFVMLPIYAVTNDSALTAKIFTVFCFLLAVICAYIFALKLSNDEKSRFSLPALAAAIVYAFNPFILSFTLARGLLPAALAIALIPLTFVLLLEILRKPKLSNIVLYAISLSIVFLAHLEFGYAAGLGGAVYAIGYLLIKWYKGENSGSKLPTRDVLSRLGCVIVGLALFLAFTAFWWIPFFKEANRAETTGVSWDVVLLSKNVKSFVDRGSNPLNEQFGYIGIGAILLSLPCFISRKNRAKSIGLLLMFIFGLVMALGVNTQVFQAIPLASLMQPDRFLVISALALAGMVYLSLSFIQDKIYGKRLFPPSHRLAKIRHELTPRRVLGVSLMFLVIGSITLDYSPTFSTVHVSSPFPDDFSSACDWLKQQSSENGGRVTFVGIPPALGAYSPSLTGKPTLRGYLEMASPIGWDIGYATTDAITKNDNAFFLGLFSRFNVEYVVVNGMDQLNTLKNTGNFQELENKGPYTILKYIGRRGYLQPLGEKVLVIGQGAAYPVELLTSNIPNVSFFTASSKYVDDYQLSDLVSYKGIILYGFGYHDKTRAEDILMEYVKQGGKLIVDMDDAPKESFLSVNPYTSTFYTAGVTYSKLPIGFPLNPSYEGGPWSAVYYGGLDESWLVLNDNSPVIGVKKIYGENVLFLGYNFFFHAAYHKNDDEKLFLGDLATMFISPGENQQLEYQLVSLKPDEKVIDVNASASGQVLISVAYSTHWSCTVDGVEHKIESYKGFMSINVENGAHRIVLTYVGSLTDSLASLISISAFIGIILLFLLGEKLRVKLSFRRPQLSTLDKIPPLTE